MTVKMALKSFHLIVLLWMRFSFKVVVLLVLAQCMSLFISSCNCNEYEDFRLTNLYIENLEYFTQPKGVTTTEIYANDTVDYDSFCFNFNIGCRYISSLQHDFGNYVNATPPCNLLVGHFQIHKFFISSDRDYNENYLAGTDLSDILLIGNDQIYRDSRKDSLYFMPLKDFIDNSYFIYDLYPNYLKLIEPPSTSGKFTFNFEIVFRHPWSDVLTRRMETKEVIIAL